MLKSQENLRNSSIELLRILSMIMIIACHFASHGGFIFDTTTVSVPRLWWNFIEMGGNVGVNIFVLISGYYLITREGSLFNLRRIVKLWFPIFLYSIILYVVFCVTGQQTFDLISCTKAFLPITFDAWWFASTYCILFLIHPFINLLLRKLDKRSFRLLLAIQLIVWCLMPTVIPWGYQANNLLWFVTLYCVAAYIRLFGLNPRFTVKSYFGFFLLFTILGYLTSVVLMVLGTKSPSVAEKSLFFFGKQSVVTFLSAASLFMVFERQTVKHNKCINFLASATFGVYLIHDSNIVRPFLWLDIFKNAQYQDSWKIIPYSLVATLLVYVACTLIDLLVQYAIQKPCMKLVDRYYEIVIQPVRKLFHIITHT